MDQRLQTRIANWLPRLDVVAQHGAAGQAVLSLEGRFLSVNEAFCRMLGRSGHELLGGEARSVVHPDDQQAWGRMHEAAAAGAAPRPAERSFVRSDGEVAALLVAPALVRDDDGTPLFVLLQLVDVTPLRRMGERLRADRDLTEGVLEAIAAAVAVLDREGRVERTNRALTRLAGAALDAVVGDRFWELLAEDDAVAVREVFARVVDGGEPERIEARIVAPGDGERIVDWSFSGLEDEVGAPRRVIVSGVDLTDRRLAEQALAERERAFRLLAENSTDMISRHAPDGVYLYASPSTLQMTGWDPGELVGTSAYSYFHPDDLAAIVASHDAVLEEPETRTVQYRLRMRSGGWLWVETTSRQVLDAAGQVVELHAATRDISERRRIEESAAEAEARLRAAFAAAPIGITLVGVDGAYLSANPAFCELVGYSEPELLGGSYFDITHPDDRELCVEGDALLLRGDAPSYRVEKRYLRKDGSVVWTTLSVALVRDAADRALYFVAQAEDITGSRETSERLRYLADHDHLTGLLNRRRFEEELERVRLETVRYGGSAALLVADIDKFKEVNDTHGHHVGDELLRAVADGLRERLRASDICGRLGGDEFAVLLPRADKREAERVMAGVREAFDGLAVEIGALRVPARLSIGRAQVDGRTDSCDDALRIADEAMYADKRARAAE